MERYLIYILLHFIVCLLFFTLVQRPIFMVYNHSVSSEKLTFKDVFLIYRYGYRSDLIAASYLTAFPVLLLWLHSHFSIYDIFNPLLVYEAILAIALGLITVSDTALYKFWKFKIDSTVLGYLRSVKGTFASVSGLYTFTVFFAVFLLGALYFCISLYLLLNYAPYGLKHITLGFVPNIKIALVYLLIGGILFAIIRGVVGRPNNPGIAFYSTTPFYNHCALNPLYNLIYSLLSKKDNYAKQFQQFDKEECHNIFKPLYPQKGTPKLNLLNTSRPNVLFIVWESLCSKYIESLGGMPDVTPNFERISKEGVYFTNCYAGSFRTDRSLVCILSGYLGQPTTSILNNLKKMSNLPGLPREFKKQGYKTSVVHGGDLRIRHKREYYWAVGHDELLGQEKFPKDKPASDWGIHDGYMFEWLYDDILEKTKKNKQWYTTFQTLSSHETWKVPYDRIQYDKPANAFAYVDDCFGKFIDKLKASPAWDNLLIVVTGDHGVNLFQPSERPENTHIPFLLLGGAIKEPMHIDTLMNQTDIAATLLGQMGIPHEEFIFSRDVLADTYVYPFAFHAYINGFVFRDNTGATDYDNDAGIAVQGSDEHREKLGKVILQELYLDLSRR